MYDKFGQFINGKWQKSLTGETYEVINPATEEILGKASKASIKEIDLSLKSSEKGFEIWKNTSPWERSKIIRKISELVRKKENILANWLTLEVGKPLAEGLGEANGAADIFEWSAEEAKRIYGETLQGRSPKTKIHVYYQPVGVVAALVPWNFPITLASRKISTALSAGCAVIVKPDVITPGSVMELVDICHEAGVPPGVVNLLSGDPAYISDNLLSSNIIKKVSITGSTRVGKLILKKAAEKGCEVIKHQTHFIDDEMTPDAKQIMPPNADVSIWDVMEKCALTRDEEINLKKIVEQRANTFNPKSLRFRTNLE